MPNGRSRQPALTAASMSRTVNSIFTPVVPPVPPILPDTQEGVVPHRDAGTCPLVPGRWVSTARACASHARVQV
eukprot:6541085-Prymnesium_polylepis.1